MTLDWLTEDLPKPNDLKLHVPISVAEREFVLKSRETIDQILNGIDQRKLLIVGPCSIHDFQSSLDYAKMLKGLEEKVQESFFIVMRVYFEKPRTALGWKGFLHDPLLDGSHQIEEGLFKTRKLLKEITGLRIPIASEFLDPATPIFLADYISWGCVGARTVSSQIHRQMASQLSMPIGFKNTTEGNVDIALNAIEASMMPHTYIGVNGQGKISLIRSFGNLSSHLVLRGGDKGPNYYPDDIESAQKKMGLKKIPLKIIVDCSHDNSRKKHFNQINVFESCIDQILEGTKILKGIMLESFIHSGSQPLVPSKPLQYGISITDSCLDFATTESLILSQAKRLSQNLCISSS